MSNPYGPPPGQHPHAQQPMAPGHPQGAHPQPGPVRPQGYPQAGGMPQGHPSGPSPQQMPPQQLPPQQMAPPRPPMAPPPPGMGRLLIDCSHHWLAFLLVLFKPQVTINGRPGPALQWGENPIDLPPGQHQIQLHVNYLWKVGEATAVIPVHQGQTQDVHYAAPALMFLPGAVGPVPQEVPGKIAALAITGAAVLLILLPVLLSFAVG